MMRAADLSRRLLLAVLFGVIANAAAMAQPKVLRVVPQSDIAVLDPMFGTAWISMIHGEMVYESLFAWDTMLQPQPEMAGSWSVFAGRIRLEHHPARRAALPDGSPVSSNDVVASTRRWMSIDQVGARVAGVTAALTATGPNTIEFHLTRPYPGLLSSLAAAPARFAAVMRAKDIEGLTGQVSEIVGSGPFRFVASEFVAGHQSVYVKNENYVPRSEPPDGLSGGRMVKFDRVECMSFRTPPPPPPRCRPARWTSWSARRSTRWTCWRGKRTYASAS